MEDPQTMKAEVYDAFAIAEAKVLVVEETRPPAEFADWHGLGRTHLQKGIRE